ncbi:uncharacterized protein LOC131358936 [Hemibagrus wyckioides]|uniref:uncharacterized protein LOC131358936 n=1 Tax=Hemibagrus wyckioides TaxID=337641 RepID=UPI00266BC9BD|nr:uncharacterized protein LOC131358936 [Hemibagrus wyckioides]
MDLADRLCNELFRWIEKQEECAEHLMDLAKELEEMTTAMTAGQLVGNTATVLGSAALIGSGIATFLTGGLAAPLLVISAGITAGVGTVASVTFKLLDSWKSSKSMKDAEKTSGEIEKIWRNIESLQKKLSEEYKSQDLAKDFSFDEVQCEITARMLRAMGKRSGRYLPLSYLTRILRNDGMYRDRYQGFVVGKEFITCVSTLLVFTGFYLIFVNTATKKGAKHVLTTVIKTGMATMKTLLKGTSQAAGGAIGLVFALPDLIDNCEKLFKGENQTDASSYLRKKATEIRVAVKKIKKQLNELQEMLNEIPETECHVDLATEMCGNQTYIRGTVCMEYKQTKKQDRKVQEFIFLSTKDMGETKITSTSKLKSDDKSNKNKRQKRQSCQKKPRQKKVRLPRIAMSNLRSLPNKMEEIKEMMQYDDLFSCDLMFFTETWLNNNSAPISLDGYESIRIDRDPQLTQKRRGGGLIVFVNKAWATDVQVETLMNTQDYELMVVSIKPHGHPKGAPPLIFIHVYVPGPNFKKAAAEIAGFFYDALEEWCDSSVFLLGDFNRSDMTPYLGTMEQYVTCPTRYNNTLDLCYGNVPGAYICVCKRPLGRSDHNVIIMIPKDQYDPCKDGECTYNHTNRSEQWKEE